MPTKKRKAEDSVERSEWDIPASIISMRTSNPIRKIVDRMMVPPNPDKEKLSLSIGDPTVFGNFKCPDHFHDLLAAQSRGLKFNGYPPAVGYPEARAAIAETRSHKDAPLTAKDVVITSGCSQALEMAFSVLANEGQNVLLPNPGFSLYKTVCDAKGIEVRTYNLLPEKNWEADLEHMASLVDSNTACVLVNNPSNPCGSVFSKEHLQATVDLCSKHFLPIIADEIYENMAFETGAFHSIAPLSKDVPVLTTGGLAKQYMAPGWRIGWILIHDRQGKLEQVRVGLDQYATIILGPNSLLQSCIPSILKDTPASYYEEILALLKHNAGICFKKASEIPGLHPITPQGAMYCMVRIEVDKLDIEDDVEFCKKMMAEQSVGLLPGSCFGADNFFRVVICPPEDKLNTAWERIAEFCKEHTK